jgi:hypothetical protein
MVTPEESPSRPLSPPTSVSVGRYVLGGAIVLFLMVLLIALFNVPQAEAIFADFGAALPALTVFLINAHGGLMALAVLFALPTLAFLFKPTRKRWPVILGVILLLLLIVGLALVVLGIFLPMSGLSEGVSS